jgi:Flp pilus assembly protein TadB
MRMQRLLKRPWMTQPEYRANLEGLNIVFGAVLGFVLAGAEALDSWGFARLLLLSVGAVVAILYISASKHRVIYAGLSVVFAIALPLMAQRMDLVVPDKLMPTLLVWSLFAIVLEFAPRGAAEVEIDET